jgi:hypothetical protein
VRGCSPCLLEQGSLTQLPVTPALSFFSSLIMRLGTLPEFLLAFRLLPMAYPCFWASCRVMDSTFAPSQDCLDALLSLAALTGRSGWRCGPVGWSCDGTHP